MPPVASAKLSAGPVKGRELAEPFRSLEELPGLGPLATVVLRQSLLAPL